MIRPHFEWQVSGSAFTDVMRAEAKAPLLAMVDRHEGAESAQIMAHWLTSPATAVTIFRQTAGVPQAELLDLPFSTYRRYLKTAVDHVIHALWRQTSTG